MNQPQQPKPISAPAALAKIAQAGLTLHNARQMTDAELLSRPTIGRRTLRFIRANGLEQMNDQHDHHEKTRARMLHILERIETATIEERNIHTATMDRHAADRLIADLGRALAIAHDHRAAIDSENARRAAALDAQTHPAPPALPDAPGQ